MLTGIMFLGMAWCKIKITTPNDLTSHS